MLKITRRSMWRSEYDIHSRGKLLATWESRMWRSGGLLTIGKHPYEVRSNFWATTHTLFDPGGSELAVADKPHRKGWTIASNAQVYEFRRASMWRVDQELIVNGKAAGYIRRASGWSFSATAELEPLPVPVQMFAIAVVLINWEQANASGAG